MAGKNSSYETSWAGQWDPEPLYKHNYGSNYSGRTSSGKVSDKLGKTKTVASTGMKKVKEGATAGVHWLKLKYQKTTQKH
ncbi:hypothetical protein Leryth_019418 [Lithospermum erythrorhizon]|uniref:Uncharacterized protein n=1 Tax=Lithospermum erythrorhizon TaxID=34254 RepID=A0AAV3S3R4_LITER|nr:hypothetical protein Leryth_019418 [Lithospermum erythrorhizon]